MGVLKKNYRKLSDEQLMAGVQQRDTAAFDELYHRYSRRLLYFFYRMLGGDEEKAQDFLQDIFLKIVEKPDRFRTDKCFSAWIFAVANNKCKNEYRQMESRSRVRNDENPDARSLSGDDPYHPMEKKVDHSSFERAVMRELAGMEESHRGTFLLRYQENFSIREISEILNCSEGTVKSRLFYTARKLADKLKAFNPLNSEVFNNGKE